jgi:hypothetical protein
VRESERWGDDALLDALGDALREASSYAPVVAASGRGAFPWRTIDEDLLTAELCFDSATAPPASVRRSPDDDGSRVLVFTTELRSVEVEVLPDRLVGQFLPATPGRVEIEAESGTVATADVDEFGFFVVDGVPDGRVRLRCTTASARLITAWVTL